MSNNWTIENDPPPNNVTGDELDGLEIAQVEGGAGGYTLINDGTQVSSTTKTSPPFTFTKVAFAGHTWNIHVSKLPAGAEGEGKWTQLGKPSSTGTGNQDGDFTAQAGVGEDEKPGKAASSGKAY